MSETRFSFSKDDEIRLVTSPLTKDVRSNSISTPILPVHLEEAESEPDTERASTATPGSITEDEASTNVPSTKSAVDRETSSSAQTSVSASNYSKPLPARVQMAGERNPSAVQPEKPAEPVSTRVQTTEDKTLDVTTAEKVEHPVAKVLTSSLTKGDESSQKLRSVRSPLHREDTSAGATTSYVCTNGGMVFAYKRPSTSEVDGAAITENDRHMSTAATATKAEKSKKKLSTSNPVDPSHSPRNPRADCVDQSVDQSGESTRVGGRFSPRRMAKSLRFSSKDDGKKKKVTLSSLRIRKKKLRESILPNKPVDLEQNAGRKLSGSLECLIDAVKKEDCPDLDPFAGDLARSVSLFNVSVDLDDNSEVDPFSDVSVGRSISVTSDRSLQTESQTSNESLQRFEEDYDSDEPPPVVLRRLKRSSVHGFYDPQEYHHYHAPPPPLPGETSEGKKLEHRHSLKAIKEEKQHSRFTRHIRNKSDTSMLPPFRPPSGSKSPSITSKHHQNSSFNLFQSLQEHLKNTISMPNVFRRERHSRPVVTELAPPEISTDKDPITLLVQYQFLSLRCCPGVQSRPELRALLLSARHNTEGQNYKLSFELEPN